MKKLYYSGILGILLIAILFGCITFSGCTESSGSSHESGTSGNNVEKINKTENIQQQLVVGEVWELGSVDPGLHSYELNNFLIKRRFDVHIS